MKFSLPITVSLAALASASPAIVTKDNADVSNNADSTQALEKCADCQKRFEDCLQVSGDHATEDFAEVVDINL